MKKIHLALLLLIGLTAFSFISKDNWWILETTKEASAYNEQGEFYWKITFSEKVKKLDGQKITLKGYFYHYKDTAITLFTKNKQPFYGCSADPKTLMIEVPNMEGGALKQNKRYRLEGVLELNKTFHHADSYTFPYRITQVKIL